MSVVYSHKIYRTPDELLSIREKWDELADNSDNPLLQFDWFYSFITKAMASPWVITVYQEGILVAVAPLCIYKSGAVHFLRIIGIKQTYEPSMLLYQHENAMRELLYAIIKTGITCYLQRIPEDSSLACENFRWRQFGAMILKKSSAPSAFHTVATGNGSLHKHMRKSRLRDIRVKTRRLASRGDIEFEAISPLENQYQYLFDLAVEVESKGWKGRAGSALQHNKQLYEHFREFGLNCAKKGQFRFFFLKVDNTPIAMHMAIAHKNKLWILKLGHDETYSEYSPGILLANHTIEYAYHNNYHQYEFLGSLERWQNTWPVEKHQFVTLYIFPLSLTGIVGLFQIVLNKTKKIFSGNSI